MSVALPITYLARHGETAWTVSGRHTGLTDVPLTERGERNAHRLGERLGGMTFTRVFTSPLQRARRTCELAGFAAVAWEAWTVGLSPLAALAHAALSGILCGGVFYLLREFFFRLRGSEGLGFGDVKLAASGGVWLGWEVFPAVVTLAAMAAILWIISVALIERGWSRERKIPFATFLAPAIWICWLYARIGPV